MPHWDVLLCVEEGEIAQRVIVYPLLSPVQHRKNLVSLCNILVSSSVISDPSGSECCLCDLSWIFYSYKICKFDGPQLHIQLLASYKLGHKNMGANVKMLHAKNEVDR